ncbi:hypothetical protein RhiirA4_466312 [Rhizophagus irregularis]|uniref:RNase H type-1 domain-containing protein n=1 Tax=Rhizophagus irregularis TaxID=588596 RepID=A0A2I1GTT3_9GLOM|nr:hypothetical protein RhiirA4_466312 [Rhizophagus irregularis]
MNKENIENHIISRVKFADCAIFNWFNYGPSFGNDDLTLYEGFQGEVSFKNKKSRCCKSSYDKQIRKTEEEFSVDEYEYHYKIQRNYSILGHIKLYTDGSFCPTSRASPAAMSYAWSALDDDDRLLESFSDSIPPTYPLALGSELIAVLSGLTSLAHGSVVTILSDCAQLITLWNKYISHPFSPRLFKEPNHLIWVSFW